MCIFYFFAGLARDAGKFFTFLLMFFLFQVRSLFPFSFHFNQRTYAPCAVAASLFSCVANRRPHLCLAAAQIISEGIGLMCAVAAKDPTAAMVLSQLVLIGILCFSGFLVTRIPVYAR